MLETTPSHGLQPPLPPDKDDHPPPPFSHTRCNLPRPAQTERAGSQGGVFRVWLPVLRVPTLAEGGGSKASKGRNEEIQDICELILHDGSENGRPVCRLLRILIRSTRSRAICGSIWRGQGASHPLGIGMVNTMAILPAEEPVRSSSMQEKVSRWRHTSKGETAQAAIKC